MNTIKNQMNSSSNIPAFRIIITLIAGISFISFTCSHRILAKEKTNKKSIAQKSSLKNPDKTGDKKKKNQLENEEKKAQWIEKTLDFGIQNDRIEAVNRIQNIKNDAIKKRLLEKLAELIKKELDADVKIKAITIAGECKVKKAIPAIIEKLDDESEDVRTAAVYALKKLNATSSRDKLIKKLKSQNMNKDSNFTVALITALGIFKTTEIIKFAMKTIDNGETSRIIRESFVLFLGKLDSKEPGEFLIKLYKDDDEEMIIRSYAVNSIAKLGIKGASKDIKEILKLTDSYSFKKKKKYYNLYLYSIAALVKLGDKDVIPRLINSLRSNSAAVRLKSISLIKEFNDKRYIDILKYKMDHDPNQRVRDAAKLALKELDVDVKGEEKSPEEK